MLALALAVAGCADRPGPAVLRPTLASAPGARVVTVYVATTRQRATPGANIFTTGRAKSVNYAEFRISIPPGHKPGQIEWPGGAPDPAKTFATVQQRVLDEATFEREVARPGGDGGRRKVGVFVHGFNTNFQEALFRLAQISADAKSDAAPILFAWPSEASVTGYVADKDAVTYSRDELVALLATLARRPAIGEITLVGHSMGGWLVAEALRQLRLTGKGAVLDRLQVVLAAPDIDVDVFRAQMAVIGPMRSPLVVLVSRDDVALSLSRFIAGSRQRLGALDVNNPQVQEAALKANVQIVDITSLKASDSFKHNRLADLAAFYPQLTAAERGGGFRHAGAFIFDAVGATLSAPFSLAGRALSGG